MTTREDWAGGRIVVSAPHLRRGSRVLEDGSKELHALARRVRDHPLPPMPRELAVRVTAEAAEIARRLETSWSPISTYATELRVRALWAEVAGARAHNRPLTDAQRREVFALMLDGSLLRFATDRQARWAGRLLGRTYRDGYEDPAKLVELAALLRANGKNEDFVGGFVDRFGAGNLAEIPRVIQAMEYASQLAGGAQPPGSPVREDIARALVAGQPGYRYGGDPVRDLLAPFAQALAVATSSGTLSRERQRELAADPDAWAVATLLTDDGRYGKGFLLDLFRNDVVDRIVAENRGEVPAGDGGLALGGADGEGGLPADAKVLVLDALSRNHDAAAAAFTRELPELELHRADGTAATVSDPVQLLLEFGTYADEGRALGEASASAVDGLHDDGEHGAANRISNRLVDEVVGGREDLGAIRDGVARTVATHDVMEDLHRIAGGGDGRTAIDLSTEQVRDLLGELSERDVARDRLLDGVARYQEGELREPGGGRDHAEEISAFNRLLVEGVGDSADEAPPPAETPPAPPAGSGTPEPPAQPAPAPAVPAPAADPAPAPTASTPAPADTGHAAPAPAPSDAEAQAWLDEAEAGLAAPAGPLDWDFDQAEEMRARLHVAIVGGYFESGDLGTREEIRAEIRRLPDTDGFEPKPFFDRWGHVLGYDAMDTDQRLTFEAWLETDRVQEVVGDAIEAAETGLDARLA